jgi:PAS domain S-box-containing protein
MSQTFIHYISNSEEGRALFQKAPIGIAFVSTSGKFIKVNQELSKMLGYSEGELFTKTFADITHQSDKESDLFELKRVLDGEIPEYYMFKRYICKNGTILNSMLYVQPVWITNTKIVNYFTSFIIPTDVILNEPLPVSDRIKLKDLEDIKASLQQINIKASSNSMNTSASSPTFNVKTLLFKTNNWYYVLLILAAVIAFSAKVFSWYKDQEYTTKDVDKKININSSSISNLTTQINLQNITINKTLMLVERNFDENKKIIEKIDNITTQLQSSRYDK